MSRYPIVPAPLLFAANVVAAFPDCVSEIPVVPRAPRLFAVIVPPVCLISAPEISRTLAAPAFTFCVSKSCPPPACSRMSSPASPRLLTPLVALKVPAPPTVPTV